MNPYYYFKGRKAQIKEGTVMAGFFDVDKAYDMLWRETGSYIQWESELKYLIG